MRMSMLAPRRLVAVAAAAVLVLGAAACGDSDDGDGGGSNAASSAATESAQRGASGGQPDRGDRDRPANPPSDPDGETASSGGSTQGEAGGVEPPVEGTSEEERVSSTVTGMYADFAAGDAAGVCSVMSSAARKQIAEGTQGGGTTCEESFSRFLDAAAASGVLEQTLKTTVGNVEVDGDVALATVSLGGQSGRVRLVKEDGEWRLGRPPGATSPGSGG